MLKDDMYWKWKSMIIDFSKLLNDKNEYGRYIWFETTNEQRPIISEYVIKSSPNIIDLIEVGDYVNGKEVINCKKKWIQLYDKRTINDDEIKSIVTKEQFKSMEYKVGE